MPAITRGRCIGAIWETTASARCALGHEGKPKLRLPAAALPQQLEKALKHAHAIPQLLQVELLVGSVQPVVGKADSRQEHRRALPAQRRYDGNRATGPRRDDAP